MEGFKNMKYQTLEENHEIFKKILTECKELRWKKLNDYGFGYNEYGYVGLLVKLGDKYNRIKNLYQLQQNNVKPNFETSRDSLVDLVNYSIMAIMELDRKGDKK